MKKFGGYPIRCRAAALFKFCMKYSEKTKLFEQKLLRIKFDKKKSFDILREFV